jgi:hypothetical protein
MVNGNHVVAAFRLMAERRGSRVDLHGCHVFRLNDRCQIAEGWGFTSDQAAPDAFFAA